ncbi:MAG: hypothetical protein J4F49_08910 [Rhodobacteraceae bacterium]|nr:hypothetical protein [Paracoccaceae bacterium]
MNHRNPPRRTGVAIGQTSNPNGVEWTDDEIHRLIDLWKRHVPFGRIAKTMGRSKKSVSIKASRLGLTTRPYWNDQFSVNARKRGKARSCLSCRRTFFSEGPGNRICNPCKESPHWEQGNDFAYGNP